MIKCGLSRQKGVFEVVYIESLIDSIQDNLKKVSLLFLSIAAMLLLTSTWLIRNTIKLSIFSQRFLIRTMELVGAEPWFIQRPYVVSMLVRGVFGGGLSVILILFALQAAQTYVPQLKPLLIPEKTILLLVALPLFGGAIGSMSAWFSVRRFQGRKLDELHNFQ
jgi:cell division transport system permease protein